MSADVIEIAGRKIGPDHPPYVIAEMSGNHNGDLERAKMLIRLAAEAGADAVKLQTYTADTITIDSDRDEFIVKDGMWKGRRLYELYQEAHTPWEWHAELFAHAREHGITIFSSPFDETAVDLLEELGAPAYKIASAEITHFPLMDKVAKTGKPVIVSTGMAEDAEIREAVDFLKKAGAKDLIVLHCISAYPTPISELNLRRIPYIAKTFDVQVGLSDHSMGVLGGVAGVVAGATVLEKHFTDSREKGGVDSGFSLDEHELKELCKTVKEAHEGLGNEKNELAKSEAGTRQFRRSIYFVKPVAKGETITEEHIKVIRPASGLEPRHYWTVLGSKAATDIPAKVPAEWSMIERS